MKYWVHKAVQARQAYGLEKPRKGYGRVTSGRKSQMKNVKFQSGLVNLDMRTWKGSCMELIAAGATI